MSNPMSPANALKTSKLIERPAKTSKGHYETKNNMGDQSGGRKVTAASKKKKQSKKYKVKVTEMKSLT